MKKIILASDIDEVTTLNHIDAFCDFINKKYGFNIFRKDFISYNFGQVLGVPEPEAVEMYYDFYESGAANNIIYDPKAINLFKKIYEHDGLIYLLSSKQMQFYDFTCNKIIKEAGNIFQDIAFTNEHLSAKRINNFPSTTKQDVLKKIKPQYYMDDLSAHIENSAVTTPNTHFILYGDYPWNKKINLNESSIKFNKAYDMDVVEKIILNGK